MSTNQKKQVSDEKPSGLKLQRNKANILRFTGNSAHQKTIYIYPGVTVLSVEQVDQIKSDKYDKKLWDELLENGVHRIVTGKLPSDEAIQGDLTVLNADEAKKAIKGVESKKQLQLMLNAEKNKKARASVMDAIEDRIKEITDSRNS